PRAAAGADPRAAGARPRTAARARKHAAFRLAADQTLPPAGGWRPTGAGEQHSAWLSGRGGRAHRLISYTARPDGGSHHVAHHRLALRRRALVEFRIHPAVDALAGQPLLELRPDRRVFLVIGNCAAALAEINRAVVGKLLARHAGL